MSNMDLRANSFLAALSPEVFALISPQLRRVSIKQNAKLCEENAPVKQVVLPLNAIISVTTVMLDGKQIESRTIGREGGFGLLHAVGARRSYERVIVQVAGEAVQIEVESLRKAALASPPLVEAVVRHAQATLVQTAQFMACNTLHSASSRLCRWLLMTQDRLQSDLVPLTQEHLSIMLGVQRTTVTTIAIGLQEQGLITYRRGKIQIRDRDGLKRCACECYEAVTRSVEGVLSEGGPNSNHST